MGDALARMASASPLPEVAVRSRATTTVDVHRDADTADRDEYADETETAGTPVYVGIPFSLIERTQRVPGVTTGSFINITALVGRSGAEHAISTGDRVQDKRTGWWYSVTQVSHPQNPALTLDRRYELRRV